jgi:hydroxymethylbilane synthase
VRLTVGTRGSPLALQQTNLVLEVLRRKRPDVEFMVKTVQTTGDLAPETPMQQLPRGLFAKELEAALANGDIDLAVHSFKDLPTDLLPGFAIAAIGKREDPRDVVVCPSGHTLETLPDGSTLGTSSPRRMAMLKAYRPGLRVVPVRGNIGTRIRKARDGGYDAVVLAAAGIRRLGLENEITQVLPPEVCLPAVGQGALAVEVRAGDGRTRDVASAANHPETALCVSAEMAVLHRLSGGCRVPIAAYARLHDQSLHLMGMVASLDGNRMVRATVHGRAEKPAEAGQELAQELLDLGAGPLLQEEAA